MDEELPHALIGTLTATLRTWLDALQHMLEAETSKLESHLQKSSSFMCQDEEASGPSVNVAWQSSESFGRPDLCNLPVGPPPYLCSERPATHTMVEVIGPYEGDADFEAKFGPLTTIVRTLLSELRCVFEVEASKLEALFRASVLKLGTKLPSQSEVLSDSEPYLNPRTLFTDSSQIRSFQERSASGHLATPSPVSHTTSIRRLSERHGRLSERHGRRALEQADHDMAESAFQAKFCRGGPEPAGRTLVPAFGPFFASPLPIVQDGLCQSESYETMLHSNSTPRKSQRLVIGAISFLLPRCCGIIPWEKRWVRASSVYQWGVMMSLCGSLGGQLCELVYLLDTGDCIHLWAHVWFTFGTLLSLLACGTLWSSRSFVHCLARLDACMVAYDCRYRSDYRYCVDTAASLSVLVVVVTYFGLNDGIFSSLEYLFVFVGLFFCGIACELLRMCRMVGWLIDSYFAQSPAELSDDVSKDAIMEWYLVDSLCRLVSSTVQTCFISLQLTATVLLCFALVDHFRGHASPELIVPAVVCALSVLRIALCAASVSEKCANLPRLLIASGNGQMEPGRKDLAEYITHCKSGFTLFGMRLSFELVFKLLYSCGAALVALVSQSVLKNFDQDEH